jgi:hypothetical protein
MEKKVQVQGVRPRVILVTITVSLIVTGLLISFGHKKPLKSVEPSQTQISVEKPVATPVHHLQEITTPSTNPSSDFAPETEVALAQSGLSAKNGIKLSVAAHSLLPVILPKTQ